MACVHIYIPEPLFSAWCVPGRTPRALRAARAALPVSPSGFRLGRASAAAMSGFSPELIDYLEGKISFEEFERRREERKTREKKVRRRRAGGREKPELSAGRGAGGLGAEDGAVPGRAARGVGGSFREK